MLETATVEDMMDELGARFPNVLLVIEKPTRDGGSNVYTNVRGSVMACIGMAWSVMIEHQKNVDDATEEL